MFFVVVGFWNFVGVGVFGFFINLLIVFYYEIGIVFIVNYVYGVMMGVYGMMVMVLVMFVLRYFIFVWNDKLVKILFWCMNIGFVWMVFVILLLFGIL